MQVPILRGVFTDNGPNVRVSYPVNLVPVPTQSGVSQEYLRPADGLIRHEQAHWRQWQRMGTLRFYLTYIWYTIRHGYRNNPMEIEARKAEEI
jgi:hypothetical protein